MTPAQLVQAMAEKIHRNESMHRHHDIEKATCSYCLNVAALAASVVPCDGSEDCPALHHIEGCYRTTVPDILGALLASFEQAKASRANGEVGDDGLER